jgi:hypothetical protein
LNETVRRIFGRVLKELDDLDNPMRTSIGSEPGQGALMGAAPAIEHEPATDVGSRFDPGDRIVYYNDQHPDYLLLKGDEPALLDYMATLVAKEYVVYNNPRAAGDELAEEMVRMVVRVRRHLPRR